MNVLYLIFSLVIGYPSFPYPFDVLILMWIGILFSIQLLFKKFHRPKPKRENIYRKSEDFTLTDEIQRKVTHLFILGLVFVYLGLGTLVYGMINTLISIADSLGTNFWGIPRVDFPVVYENWSTAIFGTFCAFLLMVIPEMFRLFSNENYMLYRVEALMREKERHMPGAAISLSCASLIPVISITYID